MKTRFLTVICTILFAGFSYAQTLNESFTEETFPPQGWTVYGDGVNDWGRSDKSSNYHTEPAGARVYIGQNLPPFDEWLITPRLDLTATPGIDTLKFWAKTSGTFAAGEKYSIRLSTTNLDTASFTNILYEITTVTDFIEIKIPLNSFESENCVYVAFQAELSWVSYRAALDDVSGPPLYSQSIDVGTTALSIFTIPLKIADTDTIAGTFKNFGTSTVKDFYGYFQASGVESYLDSVLIDSLQPQQEIVKEFYWTPNTEGNVSLSVYTQLDGDGIPGNDITSVTDKVYQTYAIYESFEGSFPPVGWLKLDYGTVGEKSWDQLSFDPYDGEYAAICPKLLTSKSSGEYDEWLITPQLYCDASTKDTLQFYIRRGNENPFSLTVRLSTTTPDTAEFNATLLEVPGDIPMSIWNEYKAPLEAFDGNSIYIAFHYENTDVSCSTVQLDMVTAPSLYFSSSDVGVDSIKAPEDSSVVTAPVQPRAVVRNYGNESQTFDVKCEIDIPGQSGGNEYVGNLTVTDLAAYSDQEVIFTEWTPSDFNQQKYIVKFYTSLAGDEFPQNDTLTAGVWTDEALPTNDDFASAYYIPTSDFRDTSYTMGMTNDYDSYGTIPWPETGPDVVYA
ncbi:MAG: choice-of-anchor J domain-containing protein, partial [Calditrichales bacterium]|nr:choice-of-anchor J domain-containing protein [Calditrichales bacterium]